MLLSRRRFGVLAAAAAAGTRYAGAAAVAISGQQLLDRVGKALPNWPQSFPAGLIAGDLTQPVRGVAATSQATVDVLRKAVDSGANLIFTCEPTFFSVSDGRTGPPSAHGASAQAGIAAIDPVLVAKQQFIEKNKLMVYRIAHGWQSPDDFSKAVGETLGWAKMGIGRFTYTIPARPLGAVLTEIRSKLGIRGGMRAVGKPGTMIRRVVILPGLRTLAEVLQSMPQCDLLLVGETRDWEGAEYSADAVAAGMAKAYAQIGRVVSEDPGMVAFAAWMQSFLGEENGVAVHGLPAGDPYWRPM